MNSKQGSTLPTMSQEQCNAWIGQMRREIADGFMKQLDDGARCLHIEEGDGGLDEKDMRTIAHIVQSHGYQAMVGCWSGKLTLVMGETTPEKQSSSSSSSSSAVY